MRYGFLAFFGLLLFAGSVPAATLEVGEGKAFARLEDALAKAAEGDTIVVYPRSAGKDGTTYPKTALQVRTPKLTIRTADEKTLIKLDGTGFDYSGAGRTPRAIVQFDPAASGCTLEGFELTGASNESHNGAGVRINQANNITVRRCLIHHNDMGIMSNGSAAAKTAAGQLIEACTITDNGTEKDPGFNHNLYLGGTSVTVRGCEIARALTGHNLKSRAHFNWIEYNYIHDSANRELDLVDEKGNTDIPGSDAVLLGNFIVKKPRMDGNRGTIHFGQDGSHDHQGTLYLAHNTIVTPYIAPVVTLSAAGAKAVFLNNLVSDRDAKQAGVLVAVTKGAPDDRVSGDGNAIPDGFRRQVPAAIKTGPPLAWDKLDLPWAEGKRPALQEFLGVGKIQPRKTSDPGAGSTWRWP